MNDRIIEEAAKAILAARDFCATPQAQAEAAMDVFHDHGIDKPADRVAYFRKAQIRANAEWAECQRAAGVPEKYWVS